MASNPELVELFGAEFAGNIANAVGELTPELEGLLVNVSKQMGISATVFGEKLEKQAGWLLGNGLSQDAVKANLTKDMTEGGRIFGEMQNAIKADLAEATNQAGRMGQIMEQGEKELFYWITVGGHRVCPDCDARAGEAPQPYSYWVENGLPGTGWSVCQGWCYCVLDPTGKLPEKVNMPAKVAEKQATKPKIPITRTNKYPNKKTYTDFDKLDKASHKYWENRRDDIAYDSYYSYYHGGYKPVNNYARGQSKSIGKNRYDNMIKDYDKQPGFRGTSYRGSAQKSLKDFKDRLKPYLDAEGSVITEDMWLSSSHDPLFAAAWRKNSMQYKYRIDFVIKGKTGVTPDGLAISAEEAEILFRAKSQFKVSKVHVKNKGLSQFSTQVAKVEKWMNEEYVKTATVYLEEI